MSEDNPYTGAAKKGYPMLPPPPVVEEVPTDSKQWQSPQAIDPGFAPSQPDIPPGRDAGFVPAPPPNPASRGLSMPAPSPHAGEPGLENLRQFYDVNSPAQAEAALGGGSFMLQPPPEYNNNVISPSLPPPTGMPSAASSSTVPPTPIDTTQRPSLPSLPANAAPTLQAAPPSGPTFHAGDDHPTFGQRMKHALVGFGLGALKGAQTGDLAGVLAGGVTGGALSYARPKAGDNYKYETIDRPREQRDIARADQQKQRDYESKKRDLDIQREEGQIAATAAQTRQGDERLKLERDRLDQGRYTKFETDDGIYFFDSKTGDVLDSGYKPTTKWAATKDANGNPIAYNPKNPSQVKPIGQPGGGKLTAQDMQQIKGDAAALVTKAFPAEQAAAYTKNYFDQAFSKRKAEYGITPQMEQQATDQLMPNAQAAQMLARARAAAEGDVKEIVKNGTQRWQQAFEDELIERRKKGQGMPQPGTPVTPEQAAQVQKAKGLDSYDDAVRFLTAFGYVVTQGAPAGSPSGAALPNPQQPGQPMVSPQTGIKYDQKNIRQNFGHTKKS
jgi:hypothetical protein